MKYLGIAPTALCLLCAICKPVVQAQEQEREIKIGWIGPLSGSSAVLGVDSVAAAQMAFNEINAAGGVHGVKLKLIAEDDQYLTSKTVAAYQKLVSADGVKFVFVLTYGGIFAVAERAKRDGIVIVDPLDCNERIGALNEHVLCVAKTTESLGTVIADQVVEHGMTPTGILYFESDPFPKETAEHARARLAERGVTPAVYEGYAAETRDFNPLVERLRAAKVKSLIMYGYDEMGQLARQVRDRGLQLKLYSFATVTSPGFLHSAQGSAEGITIVNWTGEGGAALERFLGQFRREKGRDPFIHLSTIPSYDVAVLLARCLKQGAFNIADQTVATAPLLKCFYETKNYAGISGNITMDSDGVTRSFNHVLATLKGSELVPLAQAAPAR